MLNDSIESPLPGTAVARFYEPLTGYGDAL